MNKEELAERIFNQIGGFCTKHQHPFFKGYQCYRCWAEKVLKNLETKLILPK